MTAFTSYLQQGNTFMFNCSKLKSDAGAM